MRKRLLLTLLIAVLLGVLFSASAYAETATITGDEVNLRSGPGINYEVLGCFPAGTVVTVHDRSNSQWYSVTVEGARGFMSSYYLRLEGGEQETEETVTVTGTETGGEAGVINAMYVRFRSGPSLDASILGEYNRGTALTILGTEGDWTAVIINGTRGYVFSTYVSRGSEAPATPPPEPTPEPAPEATPEPTPAPTEAPAVSDGTNAVLVKDDVYLYCEPSFYSDIKGAFDKGDRLRINGETGDWYIVNIQGFPGYIYKDNVRKDEVPAPTPTPAPEATPAPTDTPVTTEPRSGYVNADHVHLRSGPSTSSAIKGVYNRNTRLTITGESGDWMAVTIEGTSGYMFKTYVTADAVEPTPEPTPAPTEKPAETGEGEEGYVTGNNVRLRSQPSMAGEILGEYNSGTPLTIVGSSGDWTEVVIGGKRGYMYSGYVAKGKVTVTTDPGDSYDEGVRMAQFALQYVGYPYVWAGRSPETGFDCSGLTYYTYTSFGYSMYRVADDQTRNGVHVDPDDLQPGDLLCFYSGGSYVGHVGIYIGNGKFVHASTYTTGVIISELDGYYINRCFEARRIAGTSKDGPGDA